MGIKQLYNDNLRKLPNEYGDVSVMKSNRIFSWSNNPYKCWIVTRTGTANGQTINLSNQETYKSTNSFIKRYTNMIHSEVYQ